MDEDSISMYLSFESSNSTMSTTAAYKTLTDLSGVSALETMDVNEVDLSSHLNRTLEAAAATVGDKSMAPTQMQMLIEKKFEDISMKIGGSPLRPFTKNILQEYRAMCSTPTKEQLMRTVDVTRGSEAAPCADLGAAFSHFDEDKPKNLTVVDEDSKENTQPESGDGSTMSSSVEIVSSIIERKAVNSLMEPSEAKIDLDEEATPKASCVSVAEPEPKKAEGGATKPRRSLMPPKVRYSKYQPNFLGLPSPSRQRPTSILKPSALANGADPLFVGNEDQVSAEIPKLLSQMLKITSAVKENSEKSTVRMLNAIKGRASMLPSALEKRPYNFTSRMSTVVKTTLNSPARKIARRSAMPAAARPSVAGSSQLPKPPMTRKSMLPVNNATAKTAANAAIKTASNAAAKRAAGGKEAETPSSKPLTGPPKSARLEATYTCSHCSAKFRVKSLLDAHKRSHETDTPVQQKVVPRPSIMTASSSSAASSLGSGSNQCKYCDKKFALVRALHIHLMQNCPKIPPGDKKKLQFTELDHVEKAQLPFHTEGAVPLASQRSKSASKALLLGSMESLNGKKDVTKSTAKTSLVAPAASSSAKTPMAAPSSGVPVRLKTAHSGVYRTPTKTVKCKQCKLSFKSIMEHIDHNLKVHPRAPKAGEQIAEQPEGATPTNSH